MSRLWGVYANQPLELSTLAVGEHLSLGLRTYGPGPIAWGLGFYQGGEPLVRKCPVQEECDADLIDEIGDVRTDVLIGHVRAPTVGALRNENTHPFRFRQWLFVHSGTVLSFSQIRGRILNAMPEFLQRSVSGDTDSECVFGLFLSFLYDARQLDDPRLEARPAGEALGRAVLMIDELAREAGASEESPFNVLVTNGYVMLGLRRGPRALGYLAVEAPRRSEARLRAVLMADEVARRGEGWTDVPNRSTVQVGRDLAVEVVSF